MRLQSGLWYRLGRRLFLTLVLVFIVVGRFAIVDGLARRRRFVFFASLELCVLLLQLCLVDEAFLNLFDYTQSQ
jgi:hypothetical protein